MYLSTVGDSKSVIEVCDSRYVIVIKCTEDMIILYQYELNVLVNFRLF